MPLRFLTAGESHGPALTAILEGLPAGIPVDRQRIDAMMARRQIGHGSGGRMKIERDAVRISSGVLRGRTTGGPVAISIRNRDWSAWQDKAIEPMTIPRPGHADLAATLKYGYDDLRVALERASARETAARVAIGALCLELLLPLGIRIGGYVTAIGDVALEDGFWQGLGQASSSPIVDSLHEIPALLASRWQAAEASPVRCPDSDCSSRMVEAINAAARARDTLGGIIEVVAVGLPPGLGSHVHWDRRLSSRLAAALISIPSVKGVEIGPAFRNAARRGTEVHDRYAWQDEADGSGPRVRRVSGRGGGLEGGMTTGEPLVLRLALKPISTTLTPLPSVDLATGGPAETRYERSDICAVPRAVVIAEAVMAITLCEALLEVTGGDTFAQVSERFEGLGRGRLSDFHLAALPWRLDLDEP